MNWTREQLQSITTTGKSLLVSAAAGSGKTAVLAERCAYLICDAPQKCDVDELLVVTFTKAAAAEMRSRIEQALRKRIGDVEDPRLTKQLLLMDRAQINTLHAFCQSVIRRHFHLLGLDPNFRILDEEETWLLKLEIARELLDDRYESDSTRQFQKLIDLYGNGDDETILRRVISLNELMGSVVDPQGWLRKSATEIAEARNAKPLSNSKLGRDLAYSIQRWIVDIRSRWVLLATQLANVDGLEAYGEYVNEIIAAVEGLQHAFGSGNFDGLAAEFAQFKMPALPRFKNPPPEKEHYQAAIDTIRKQMQNGPLAEVCCFSEQQWRDGLAAIYAPARSFVDLVRDFDVKFAEAKRELRGIDFTDLERFTLNILRGTSEGSDLSPSPVAKSYQAEFKHVLVDEYQDINEVQDAILKLISRESYGRGSSNLFTVGDVKQSIYRFRLAQPERFLKRYADFQAGAIPRPAGKDGGEVALDSEVAPGSPQPLTPTDSGGESEPDLSFGVAVDLSANFRSRGPLINVINAVFERIMSKNGVEIEYDQSHRLQAGASYPGESNAKTFHGSPVELHLIPPPPRGSADDDSSSDQDLDRTEREASFIGRRITKLMSAGMQIADRASDGSMILRPVRYRDIVVLLRSMKYKSEQFADILRGAGIPVHTDSGTGFFESMEIRDMLALLRLLDNQQQDVPLAAVLRSPLSGLADADDCMARIRLAYPDADRVPFHQAAAKYPSDHDDELAAQLRAFFRTLDEWRRLAHQRPLAEVLWQIYDSTGYLAFCSGMSDGEQRVANLIDFHERARQFGSFQRQGLSRFMEFLNTLAEQSDLGQPSVSSEADDVVRVMSIHRSKGLEFPIVFLPDLGKQHNMQDTHGPILVDRDAGIGLMVADETLRVKYPSLAYLLVQQRIKQQTLAEEMRVLYVGMTRAREHLILVGSCEQSVQDNWNEQWSKHIGPLPAERILSGRTMLDWIGPASAAIQGSGAADRIEITWHDETEVGEWTTANAQRHQMSPERAQLAGLVPLDPPPMANPAATAVEERLTVAYPFRSFTILPAAQSVGALTKSGRAAPGGHSPSVGGVIPFEVELAAPRCVIEQQLISATDAGAAAHLVLQHLNFARACDRADLRAQVADLIAKRLIDRTIAESVDLDSIVWLTSTNIGATLRRHSNNLRRELPIYYPMHSPEGSNADPLDQIMIRGRIDVLIDDGDGLVIVDFKTDRLSPETVDARAAFHAPQITAYREAVQSMTARPVRSAVLVFLQARQIRAV